MNLEKISQAYRAENLTGSPFTAPLRSYNRWFQGKIEASQGSWQRLAWKVTYVVSAIFAYLILGIVALIGIGINLCLLPPENGYSLWARLNGVPKGTEAFCSQLRERLSFASKLKIAQESSDSNLTTTRSYAYRKGQQLSFVIPGISGEVPPSRQVKIILQDENGALLPAHSVEETQAQEKLIRLEPHIAAIQNTIVALSQKHGWFPEKQLLKVAQGNATVTVPIPDHIPFPV